MTSATERRSRTLPRWHRLVAKWDDQRDGCTTAVHAGDLERRSDLCRAFVHAPQSPVSERAGTLYRVRIEAAAVVANREANRSALVAEDDMNRRSAGMRDRIRDGFLSDAERGHLGCRRESARLAFDVAIDA